MELMFDIVGYTVIVTVLAGIAYACYKILRSEIKDVSENDD